MKWPKINNKKLKNLLSRGEVTCNCCSCTASQPLGLPAVHVHHHVQPVQIDVEQPGWSVPGWTLPGWNIPGWNIPGWTVPGWTLPGWNVDVERVSPLVFAHVPHITRGIPGKKIICYRNAQKKSELRSTFQKRRGRWGSWGEPTSPPSPQSRHCLSRPLSFYIFFFLE